MRALPHFQVVDKRNGVAQYTVTSKPGWLSTTWLDAVLVAWFLFLYLDDSEHIVRSIASWSCPLVLWGILKCLTRRKESLLVMQGIGAQLSSQIMLQVPRKRATFWIPLSRTSKLFIPESSIQEIVLLEGIQGWSIIWYLAIAQKESNSTKLHVIFKHSLPSLSIIRKVWHDSRQVLELDRGPR